MKKYALLSFLLHTQIHAGTCFGKPLGRKKEPVHIPKKLHGAYNFIMQNGDHEDIEEACDYLFAYLFCLETQRIKASSNMCATDCAKNIFTRAQTLRSRKGNS